MSSTDHNVRRIGELITVLMMGLVIQQASFGFAASLNKVLNSYPAVSQGEWAILWLLLILLILGVDFLVWAIRLSNIFELHNIVWNFLSATATLVLVHIVADEGFEIESGVWLVASLGIIIPVIYLWNFGCRMEHLPDNLRWLKVLTNPIIAILSLILLVAALNPVASIEGLFLRIVLIMAGVLLIYGGFGWVMLFKRKDASTEAKKGEERGG